MPVLFLSSIQHFKIDSLDQTINIIEGEVINELTEWTYLVTKINNRVSKGKLLANRNQPAIKLKWRMEHP